MSTELKQPTTPPPAATDTAERGAVVPVWLIVLLALLLYWGAIYFDENGGWFNSQVYAPYKTYEELASYQPPKGGVDLQRGEQIFNTICALCHGPDGMGKPGQAPPLAGSEWVTAPGVNRLIRIPVLGLVGPIEVKGQQYIFGSGMTAVAANSLRQTFTDEDLAAVLSYIRQAWGNKAPPVTVEQVKAIRDEVGNRSQPLKVDELKSLPESK